MPCNSGMESSGYDYTARRELERLTRVSCEIMGALERLGITAESLSPEVSDWWLQHKAEDARREAAAMAQQRREQLRDAGLSKLSPEERRALGL